MIAGLADATRTPRSFTIHFASPPADGPCEVLVVEERRGRSLATLSARLEQDGKLRAIALGAFSPAWPAQEIPAGPPPEAPPAAEVEVLEMHPAAPDFFSHIELRPTLGGFVGSGGTRVGGWMRPRPSEPLDAPAAAFLLDAMWPAIYPALEKPVGAPTVDLTVHFRRAVPPIDEPLLAQFSTRELHEGFFEEDGELWLPDGTLLAQSRQLALLVDRG
jgi:acyl-coenzyme A thioesterase PaaI-like protein